MKTLLITTTILSQFVAGYVLADQARGDELEAQCKQEAISAAAVDVNEYVYKCLDEKLEYDLSE